LTIRKFLKVGYSTESRSTGVDRLALRNQTICFSKTNFIADDSLVRSTIKASLSTPVERDSVE